MNSKTREKQKYYAHKKEDGILQPLHNHLEGTADLCKKFAEQFDAGELGYFIGILHDIGKYSNEFQDRLLNNGPKVDHSTSGASECIKHRNPFAAFCISGHHGGIPNGGSRIDLSDSGTLSGRINRASKNEIPDYSEWKTEVDIKNIPQIDNLIGNHLKEDFFIRMLFSSLVDADFRDTENFMTTGSVIHDSGESIDILLSKLNEHTDKWFPPKSELNRQRCAILTQCIKQGKIEQPESSLFSLTVPTSGGKTTASMAFALHHAVTNNKRRIIYVVPYTSIIEQTAVIFRKIFGENNVLEHHSGVIFDSDDFSDSNKSQMMLATEDWDKPIVITTAVQFFESIYSNRPSKCRKLHNIANSVIVFDEAQMIPLQNLRPCVSAISQLVANFKATAILCTATQPALNGMFNEFAPGMEITEICPDGTYDESVFKRVTFNKEGLIPWHTIAERMSETPQVLCIVNTRKSAKTLFSLLKNEDGVFHLSTRMAPAHRRRVLDEIRERLCTGLPCRVVSTSLIEAGVDIDFPIVLREIAGLDSMLQAAGRCNREGKHSANDSKVILFSSESPVPQLFAKNVDIGKMAIKKFDDIASEEAISFYFKELLLLSGEDAQDKSKIIPGIIAGDFQFATIAEEFKMIDSDTLTVYVPWEDGKELIEEMKQGNFGRTLFRKAAQYAIQLERQYFNKLFKAGVIHEIGKDQRIWYLEDSGRYDDHVGIIID